MRTKELTKKHRVLAEAVEARLGEKLVRLPTSTGELGYQVKSGDLLEVCRQLRDGEALELDMLMDLAGVDYLAYGRDEWETEEASTRGFSRGVNRGLEPEPAAEEREPVTYHPPFRFAVVYHLLSIARNHRLRLKVFCEQSEMPMVDSVTPIWSSADWFEREAFDLFGILFRGHPDLRRLLTDYGFIGHPFRKDFPLVGNVEMRFDPEKGRIVYEPVSIEPRTLVPKVIRDDNRYAPGLREARDPGLAEADDGGAEGTAAAGGQAAADAGGQAEANAGGQAEANAGGQAPGRRAPDKTGKGAGDA